MLLRDGIWRGGKRRSFSGEHTASSHYVFATGGTDGGSDAVVVERVAEAFHRSCRRREEVATGDSVETDEIDAAVEASYEFDKGIGIAL